MSHSQENVSVFEQVNYIQPDAIFELTKWYNADPNPRKVNLGQGTYKDGQGNPWILPSVALAKEKIRDANHEYLPILGLLSFRTQVTELIYGKTSKPLQEERIAACQSLSGTGALHLAGSFLRQNLPSNTAIYITNPSWSNHRQVFESVGFRVYEFQWYSSATGRLAWSSIVDALSSAAPGSVVVLHASAHNPTGCDPSLEQWGKIANIVKDKKLLPIFDAAYLGITSGFFEDDVAPIRQFVHDWELETIVCASFAKNMGLYGERVGHVSFVTASCSSARAVQSNLAQLTRAEISNPPAYGARITAAILVDPELRAQWERDLVTMSSRITGMRKALYKGLKALGSPGNFERILEQKGMFCILGLPASQVIDLREKYHIYMADSSRVSIAGLNPDNVEYVAAAIDQVLRAAYRE